LEQAVKWAAIGILWVTSIHEYKWYNGANKPLFFTVTCSTNMGQACCAGTRIFVQESVYDQFMELFKKNAEGLQAGIGEPFELGTMHGPQVSKGQYEVRYHAY